MESTTKETQVGAKKMSMWMKLAVLPTVALSIAMGTTACKNEDVAAVGGAIAIVAGAVAIGAALGDDDHSHRPRCRGGYVERCRSTHDRWGRRHTSCKREWDPCATRYSAVAASSLLSADMSVSTVSGKYNLPLESAERLTKALQAAHAGQADALTSLGLSQDDMTSMAKFQLPSSEGIEKMATSLALSRSATQDLIQSLMNDARSQFANVDSPAWKACTSAGKWRTPENGGTCKETYWSGCSPETGASLCVVAK
ncbi:MAG TPA: hypothetical protein PLZ57_05265 [Pseudobdellovibrionaceae bacterium]|nr:hypothetical protein [Pseudobdellovibrionaceae bacterium]